MSDDLVKVIVSDGKYTFIQRKDGSCAALRYDEPWRDDISDGLMLGMAYRIEELEKENFMLAARQCLFSDGEGLTGSPSGHAYCAKDVELEGCDEYIQSLIKTIDEGDANTEYHINVIADRDERIEELEAKLAKAVEMALDECPFCDAAPYKLDFTPTQLKGDE